VRLVICDQQRILAEALAAALSERGHQVLAVTTTAAEGVAAVGVGRPEVCVLDLQFGDEPGGLEAAHTITARHPDTKVLILSGVTDPKTLSLVRTNSAAGFIRKDQSVDQIACALEVIAGGGSVLDPGLARRPPARNRRPKNPLHELPPREKEIVARIVGGQSTRQMSFAMNITVDTVRTYVKNVLAKFGAHSRLQLAAMVSRDLVDQEPAG
jgi:two-component system, NarL family, nitrate/nitrite response regulator NarL